MPTRYRYRIEFTPGIEFDAVGEESLLLEAGMDVVVTCERFEDLGRIRRAFDRAPADEDAMAHDLQENEKGRRIQGLIVPVVRRIAGPADLAQAAENRERETTMQRSVLQKIGEYRLEMKLINLHLVQDRRLLVVQFAAEGRVDFRELLRDLSRVLHLRVELRQIGVRDETAVRGGLGCCGRPFCCATFLADFQSINVRLAKEQGLSLNPVNISGVCGRLKCCLRYEAEGYRELRRELPRPGSLVLTPDGEGKVLDVQPLKRVVRVSLPPAGGEVGPRVADFPADQLKSLHPPGCCRHEEDEDATAGGDEPEAVDARP